MTAELLELIDTILLAFAIVGIAAGFVAVSVMVADAIFGRGPAPLPPPYPWPKFPFEK